MTTKLYEDNVRERVHSGDNIVYLQDGRCIGYKVEAPDTTDVYVEHLEKPSYKVPVEDPVYMFIVEIVSTGETHAYSRPFHVHFREGWPHLIWEISNGQLVGLPITKEALRQQGAEWTVE